MLKTEDIWPMLIFASLCSFILSIILAPIVLGWYRRVLLKGMSRIKEGSIPLEENAGPKKAPDQSLSFQIFNTENLRELPVDASSNRRLTLVYSLASIVFGLVVAFGFFDFQKEFDGSKISFLSIFSLTIVAALPGFFIAFQRLIGMVWPFFAVIGIIILLNFGLILLTGNYGGSFRSFAPLYSIGLVPIVLFSLLTLRNQRAITPYLFLILSGIAPTGVLWLAMNYQISLYLFEQGSGGEWLSTFMMVSGLIFIFALIGLGWILLRWLSKRYEEKKFSTWMMEADTMIGISIVFFSSMLAIADKQKGALAVIAGFFIFQLSVRLFSFLLLKKKEESINGLLFLRVFGRKTQVQRLMQKFTFHWQFLGPVNLIAAPDLASDYLEPDELLDLLTLRTKDHFVKSDKDLQFQLSQLDKAPDPDGRYRINEFFCYTSMWKQVLHALLPHSRVVLMDLRSFSKQNQGCLYEVEQLFQQVAFEKVIFLVDKITELNFLKSNMLSIWENLNISSPNATGTGKVQFFQVKKGNSKEIRTLKGLVFKLAGEESSYKDSFDKNDML